MASATLVGCFIHRSGTAPDRADAAPRDATQPEASTRDAADRRDAGARRDADLPDGRTLDGGPVDATPPVFDAGSPILGVTDGLMYHFDAFDPEDDGDAPVDRPLPNWRNRRGSDDANCQNVTYDRNGLRPGYPAVVTTGEESSECQFSIGDFDPGDLSIAVVLRTDDGRGDPHWYRSPVIVGGNRSGAHDDAAMVISHGAVGFARRSSGQQFLSSELGLPRYDDDAPHVLVLVRDGSTGMLRLSVDRGNALHGVADSGRITEPDVWYLASHDDWQGGLRARYAEVLIYDRALDPDEATDVVHYLLARWGF